MLVYQCIIPFISAHHQQQPTVQTTGTPTVSQGKIILSYELVLTNCIFHNAAVTLDFQLMPYQHSNDVRFSLTCNSTGAEVSGIIWTRDGFLLSNTGPLVLTDSSTYSYTNVLNVNGRTEGVYTCQVRGINDQVLDSATANVQGELC